MYHGWFTKWMPPKRAGKLSCRDHRIQWLVTSEKQKISYGDCCLYIHSHWKRMSSLILITFICTTELNPQVAMNEISAASFPYLLPRVHLFNRLHYATPVAKVPVLPGLCLVLLGFTQPLEADYNNWSWPRTAGTSAVCSGVNVIYSSEWWHVSLSHMALMLKPSTPTMNVDTRLEQERCGWVVVLREKSENESRAADLWQFTQKIEQLNWWAITRFNRHTKGWRVFALSDKANNKTKQHTALTSTINFCVLALVALRGGGSFAPFFRLLI